MSAPYWSDDHLTIHGGDCREVMATMPERSVHCVVTSPPYWGLRDYGNAGQHGLEATPDAYVEAMVGVFREVRRVLRDDGTVWLNLGDSYASDIKGSGGGPGASTLTRHTPEGIERSQQRQRMEPKRLDHGLKPKDLVGIPWRVAFALQADGWYLRSDIIWSKPNPMPESVTDRPTKAHEYLFLLSKSPRYYYDADAVREAESPNTASFVKMKERFVGERHEAIAAAAIAGKRDDVNDRHQTAGLYAPQKSTGFRNLRSVWTIATEPYGSSIPESAYADGPLDTVSPDCPVHSLGAIRRTRRTASDDELLDHLRSRSRRNGSGRAPVLDDGLFASSSLDSQDDHQPTTGSPRLGSSPATTPGSAPASRTPVLPMSGDGQGSDVGTSIHTSHTPAPTTLPAAAEMTDGDAATRRSDLASRTTGESDELGSSGHSTADRTPDMDAVTVVPEARCSCPKYSESHFATFPRKLVEPCIKAGSPEGGLVLDPFAGSGTTLLVAQALGRRAVGIDLNPDYLRQCLERNAQTPLGLGA